MEDELNTRFRRIAMEAFGYGRGSISKAAAEALLQWCEGREALNRPSDQADAAAVPDVRPSPSNSSPPETRDEPNKPSLSTGS